jgi:hypothetical protein
MSIAARRAWVTCLVFVCVSPLGAAACSSSGDAHGHDGSVADASEERGTADAQESRLDAGIAGDGEVAADAAADGPACTLACPADQICCLDVHGHNPTCVQGTQCP